MRKKIIWTFFAFFFLSSLTMRAGKADTLILENLREIESYLYRDPMTAKQAMLKLLRKNGAAADSSIGLIHLKLGTAFGMTNNLDSGLWSINQALQLLPPQAIEYAGALKLQAILYRLKGDYPNAEAAIKRTLLLNDSLWKDPFQKVLNLQEYASLCLDRQEYYKATSLYLEAIQIASSAGFKDPKGSYTLIKLRSNLAEAYLQSRNYPFAIREFKVALRQLDSVKDNEGYLRTGLALCLAYLGENQLNECDQLLSKLQAVADQVRNEELQSYVWIRKGMSLAARMDFKAALPYYRSAFDVMRRNNSSMLIPECVNNYLAALTYTRGNDEAKKIINDTVVKNSLDQSLLTDKLAFKRLAIRFIKSEFTMSQMDDYYREILQLTDSVNAQQQRQSAAEILAKYQFERQLEDEQLLIRENELLKEKTAFKRKQLFFIIAIAMLVIIVLALTIVRLRQRSLLQTNQLKTKEQEINFQKDRTEWMEREKSFRDQLINQQRVVLTQAIADKEEMDLRLQELVKEKQEERRSELLAQLEKSKDKKLNIEILLAEFNAIHPTFVTQLLNKYPDLSMADAQFCTLFRMNLTTKEISVLLNIEPRSIYKKKYRTMEKMGLGEGDDFEKLLFGIG